MWCHVEYDVLAWCLINMYLEINSEKALDLANKKGLTDFKASLTWVQKFMDRNGFTIRRKTIQSRNFWDKKKMKSS